MNRSSRRKMLAQVALPLAFLLATLLSASAALRFEVGLEPGLATNTLHGRLLVILTQDDHAEPRLALDDTDPDGPFVFGRDADQLTARKPAIMDDSAIGNRRVKLSELPPGKYFVQALLDVSTDIRSVNAAGNFLSEVQELDLNPRRREPVKLELSRRIPVEGVAETESVRFVRIQSRLLSEFHKRPIYLRAGIILPAGYESQPDRRYPLWIHIGGFGTRYTRVADMMQSSFRNFWQATNTPPMIYVQPDGVGPNGDPYQVNSANNGPYGDAFVRELIPAIEKEFRAVGKPQARVLSGRSTGGWVALALQIFYPEEFAGAWAGSPDPVDFRAFQLLNIYADQNAFVNLHGEERPAAREPSGDTRLTVRRELQLENVLGRGGSWTRSGQQWGAWNAVFSPRGADGLPVPLWDAEGQVNPVVAKHWKKYDLRFVLEENWAELAPRLRGKLHLSVGDADDYFLNNAVRLLEESLSEREPKAVATFAYGPGETHGWMNLSIEQLVAQMYAVTQAKP